MLHIMNRRKNMPSSFVFTTEVAPRILILRRSCFVLESLWVQSEQDLRSHLVQISIIFSKTRVYVKNLFCHRFLINKKYSNILAERKLWNCRKAMTRAWRLYNPELGL